MRLLLRYPVTIAAMLLAVAMVLAASRMNIDFIKLNLALLDGIEKNELDDLIVGFLMIITGVSVDAAVSRYRRRRDALVQQERSRVLRATMRTVHDISNNFLGSVQLFCAECADAAPADSVRLLEQRIEEMAMKLKQLGDLDSTPEREMAGGTGIDFEARKDRAPAKAA